MIAVSRKARQRRALLAAQASEQEQDSETTSAKKKDGWEMSALEALKINYVDSENQYPLKERVYE